MRFGSSESPGGELLPPSRSDDEPTSVAIAHLYTPTCLPQVIVAVRSAADAVPSWSGRYDRDLTASAASLRVATPSFWSTADT